MSHVQAGSVATVLLISTSSSLLVVVVSWLCGLWVTDKRPTLLMMTIPFTITACVSLWLPEPMRISLEDLEGKYVHKWEYSFQHCFLFQGWHHFVSRNMYAFFIVMASSLACLSACLAWLCQTPARHRLGRQTVVYCVLVAVLNMGAACMCVSVSCNRWYEGATFVLLAPMWKHFTNAFFKRIVLARTEIHAGTAQTRCMWRTLACGYILSFFLTGSLVYGLVGPFTRSDFNAAPFYHSVVYGPLSLFLGIQFVLDAIFFREAYRNLHSVWSSKQAAIPTLPAGSGDSNLREALRVAKTNLWLVVLSVVGNGLYSGVVCVSFGGSVIRVVAYDQDPLTGFEAASASSWILAIWCFDSIFNDVCAAYIGLGATQEALEVRVLLCKVALPSIEFRTEGQFSSSRE